MSLGRIAYVVKCFPLLTQTFIVAELSELIRRGIEVRIVSLQIPVEPLRHEVIARLGLDNLAFYDPADFPARLTEFRPQLLHAHFATGPASAARSLAAQLGVPFTFTAHGYDIYYRPPDDFEARAAAAAAVITVSDAGARQIAMSFKVPRRRVHVIPNGVDSDLFRPIDRVSHNSGTQSEPGRPPQIVCVARHAPVKNLDLLLDACAILRQRNVDFRCVMVGDGPCRKDLEAHCVQLGLGRYFEWTGDVVQKEVLAWWRRASIAVLSSDSEGMPVSLIEAAACEVPAVATQVGGIEELVEHGVTGLLVPPGHATALADALERLLADPQLAARMGKAARRVAERKFSLKLQIDRLVTLWEGLLAEPAVLR